jgi:hypothetical protein
MNYLDCILKQLQLYFCLIIGTNIGTIIGLIFNWEQNPNALPLYNLYFVTSFIVVGSAVRYYMQDQDESANEKRS